MLQQALGGIEGEIRVERLRPMGEEPQLAPPIPQAFAQLEEMRGGKERVAAMGRSSGGNGTNSEGIVSRLADSVRHVVEDLTGSGREHGAKQAMLGPSSSMAQGAALAPGSTSGSRCADAHGGVDPEHRSVRHAVLAGRRLSRPQGRDPADDASSSAPSSSLALPSRRWRRSSRRAASVTLAPAPARKRAKCWPRPLDAPVTSAWLPLRSKSSVMMLSSWSGRPQISSSSDSA